MKSALPAALLALGSSQRIPKGELCRPSDAEQGGCNIQGSNCEGEAIEFQAYNLTIDKWDNASKTYTNVGLLESHAAIGKDDTWQMYLHGPMIRPMRELEEGSDVPPFYVSATFNNKVYRFDHNKPQGRGQPMKSQQKVVANAVAPSTAFPLEDDNGDVQGLLVAEGQPFLLSSPLDRNHTEFWFGGVDYISDEPKCDLVFPNKVDKKNHLNRGEVVNTVSCQKETGVCFFTVWNFYDDQTPIWQVAHNILRQNDCLHYCVMDKLDGSTTKCNYAGVVVDDNGEEVCSKKGQGAVHGMTVAHLDKEDPTQFDIFLVFTGGATFDSGESSIKKLRCQKTPEGDMVVRKSEVFGRDLFEGTVGRPSTYGHADHDVGGDHAWPDESGKYLWVSTFRVGNPGVHMLDYQTGELLYSVHGLYNLVHPNNYAYSAGIHGLGSLGTPGSTLVVGTSACAITKACAPIPYTPLTPKFLEAKGIMYVIDLSEIFQKDSDDVMV